MYHALALEDMLDLVNISQVFDGVLSEEQGYFLVIVGVAFRRCYIG